jgi:hypothetical protein
MNTKGSIGVCLYLSLLLGWFFPAPPLAAQNRGEEVYFETRIGGGLSVGVGGLPGIDIALQPVPMFTLRLGYQHFQLTFNDWEVNTSRFGLENQQLLVSSEISLNQVLALGEWAPTKGRRIRLLGGLALGLNNFISGQIEFKEPLQINDLELQPEEIGTIKGVYTTRVPIFPFVGIGFGRTVPEEKISFSVDMGVFYRGAPQIDIIGTELLDDNDSNEAILEQNLSDLRWQPMLNFRVGARIY